MHTLDLVVKSKFKKTGHMYRPKEAGCLLQLAVCAILAKILWNSEGSCDLC